MKKLMTLTIDQEQRLIEHQEEWRAIGLTPGLVTRDAVEPVFAEIYRAINLEPVPLILFSSPASVFLAVPLIEALVSNKNRPPLDDSGPIRHQQVGHGVLVRGEATGHAHRLEEATDGLLYEAPDGTLYLHVGHKYATITHEEHQPITLPSGDYRVGRVREYDHFAQEARQVRD